MIPGSANPLLLAGAAEAAGYNVERSVRFNSSDSAYLSRDFTTAGNRKTWTWSGWVKRSLISSGQQTVFGNYDGASGAYTRVGFQANDVLWFQVGGSGGVYRNITSAVYRDPGAWLHLVAVLDTTQATASNRVKLWVNGELQTFGTTDYPPLNYAGGHINQDIWHAVGAEISDTPTASKFFNGCLADCFLIDGQALDPTSFGEFDTNGVWQPKAYTGSYGTNGFHLDFSDNSSAAALGTDTSGNGNDWTVNNITANVTQPALYSSPNLYTSAADVIANGTPLSSGSTFSNVYVYLVTNGGGDVGSKVFTADGSGTIGTNWTWLHRIGASWTSSGSYNNSEWDLFTWGSQTVATNYIMNNSAPLHMLVSTAGSPQQVSGTIATFNSTPNSGASIDSLVDVPQNGTETDSGIGGEVRGNYCTWNPLDNQGLTLANGNLDVSWNTASWYNVKATIGVSTGKWYYEYTVNSGADYQIIGLFATTTAFPAAGSVGYMTVSASGWGYQTAGQVSNNNSFTSTGTTAAAGDVIMVAFDMDAAKVWFGKNGTWLNSGNPATGANAAFSNLSGILAPAVSLYGSQSGSLNTGQRPFAYTAPSGFKALCTANLPSTTITTSGSYIGNGVADGPFVYLNGVPTAMTVNGNAVTFGTHADKLSNGFKIRTTSTTYNQNASTYNYSITSTGDPFKIARAQSN